MNYNISHDATKYFLLWELETFISFWLNMLKKLIWSWWVCVCYSRVWGVPPELSRPDTCSW